MRVALGIPIFFILMPYIGLGVLPSDTQPLAILFSSIAIIAVMAVQHYYLISKWIIPLFVMSLFGAVSFMAQVISPYNTKATIELVRALAAYMTPLVIALYLHIYLKCYGSKDLVKYADLAMAVTYFGFILNIIGLTDIIQVFVNRSISGDIIGSMRGLTSFYPEQSRVSEQMGILFFVYLMSGSLSRYRLMLLIFAGILSFAGQFFIIIAELAFAYIVAVIMTLNANQRVKIRYLGLSLFCLVFLSLFLVYYEGILNFMISLGLPKRGISAALTILNEGTRGFGEDKGVLFKISGVIFALTAIVKRPFAFDISTDIGSLGTQFIDTYSRIQQAVFGNETIYMSNRIYSALGTWIVNFGILGLIIACIVLFQLWNRCIHTSPNVKFKAIWTAGFITIILFLKIPLANPSIWGLLAILHFYLRYESDNENNPIIV